MKNWFESCTTIEEIKKRYRQLAQIHHPDHNGNEETMKEINSQYEKFRFQKFTATNHETNKTYEQTFDPFDGYRELINQLLNIPNITIELCGSWLWIGGETKLHKDQLKELGFTFSAKKIMWYWHPGQFRKKSKKNMSIDEIREKYGSSTVNTNNNQREAIAV